MSENNFRTFCAVAIFVMFALIGWVVYEKVITEPETKQIHIEAPFFEYKGEHPVP
jgi:hypothetical protein